MMSANNFSKQLCRFFSLSLFFSVRGFVVKASHVSQAKGYGRALKTPLRICSVSNLFAFCCLDWSFWFNIYPCKLLGLSYSSFIIPSPVGFSSVFTRCSRYLRFYAFFTSLFASVYPTCVLAFLAFIRHLLTAVFLLFATWVLPTALIKIHSFASPSWQ